MVQQLRTLWGMVALALVLLAVVIGFALPWVPEGGSEVDLGAAVLGAVVLAAIGIGGAQVLRGRELPCEEGPALAMAYRTRFFLGIAVSELPALLGFMAAFVVGEGWLYLVGLGVSLVALSRIAPTPGDVQRVEAKLRAGGCQHSLSEALG